MGRDDRARVRHDPGPALCVGGPVLRIPDPGEWTSGWDQGCDRRHRSIDGRYVDAQPPLYVVVGRGLSGLEGRSAESHGVLADPKRLERIGTAKSLQLRGRQL